MSVKKSLVIVDVVVEYRYVQKPVRRSVSVERPKKSKQCSDDRRGPATSIFNVFPDKATLAK
jgi:hypothetical protein